MTRDNQHETDHTGDDGEKAGVNGRRRRFLKLAGVSAIGLPAAMGTAAAGDDGDGSAATTKTTTTVTGRRVTTGATQARSHSLTQPKPGQPPEQNQRSKPIKRPVSEEKYHEMKARAARGDTPHPPARFSQQAEASKQNITLDASYAGYRSTSTPYVPPDMAIAVGPNQIIQMINTEWGIYDKATGTRQFSVEFTDWWSGELADPNSALVSDLRSFYDPVGKRFILLTFAQNQSTGKSAWLLSVSDDSSPFGSWYNYRIEPAGNDGLLDYPRLGLDRNGIYLAGDLFKTLSVVEKFTVLDKTSVYGGGPVEATNFSGLTNPDGTPAFVVQPTYSPTTTSPFYMVNSRFDMGDTLTVWTVENPTTQPTLSRQAVNVGSYSLPPPVKQRDTTAKIDTGDARLLNAVYEDSDGTLWTAHTVSNQFGKNSTVAAARWYQLDPAGGSLLQSGVYGEAGTNYFYPAVMTNGDSMMMVYDNAGPLIYPRIEVAGRTNDYTQNELEDRRVVKNGESFYDNFQPNSVPQRWGDYNAIVPDPESDHYWVAAEYAEYPNDQSVFGTQMAEAYFSPSTIVPGP